MKFKTGDRVIVRIAKSKGTVTSKTGNIIWVKLDKFDREPGYYQTQLRKIK